MWRPQAPGLGAFQLANPGPRHVQALSCASCRRFLLAGVNLHSFQRWRMNGIDLFHEFISLQVVSCEVCSHNGIVIAGGRERVDSLVASIVD